MKTFEDGPEGAAPKFRRPRRLSEVFAQLARDADGPVTLDHICKSLGARAFAPMLVLFAGLNLLPLPPGSSAVLGLPLIIVAAQMVSGRRRTWLPEVLGKRSLSADQFRNLMASLVPRLARMEKLIKPRYWPFWRRQGERIVGAIALFMAIVVTLPIPGGNWLPAFCTTLLGLSLLERDGLLFALGSLVGVVAMAVIVGIFTAAGFAGHAIWAWMM
ncbi:MAG: exopolysaccharide biosynthesis protein [Rhizobiaceae bacterium]|nr:exopolysaccharide biosynthesis protein [Rhizobiaceae bacterium]